MSAAPKRRVCSGSRLWVPIEKREGGEFLGPGQRGPCPVCGEMLALNDKGQLFSHSVDDDAPRADQ